jgi:hypothetical protein
MITRILTVSALALLAGAVAAPSAQAAPEPCVQYVDPIHMGSYEVCPLDDVRP